MREERRRDHLLLGVGVELDQAHAGARVVAAALRCEHAELLGLTADPERGRPAVLLVDRPADEGRDDLRELPVDLHRQATAFGQLLAGHLGDQVLERPPVAVKAEVGQGAGREQAAEDVEGLGARGRTPASLGLAGHDRKSLADLGQDPVEQLGEGLEQVVGGQLVDPVPKLGRPVVGIAAIGGRSVEADVASGLLERRKADPGVLECLGGERRYAFHGEVGARQLGDRVVAVADQHPLVELLCAPGRSDSTRVRLGGQGREAQVGLPQEFVEEDAAEALLGSRIAGEERALDDLG